MAGQCTDVFFGIYAAQKVNDCAEYRYVVSFILVIVIIEGHFCQ